MEQFHYAAGLVPLNFEKNEWKNKKKDTKKFRSLLRLHKLFLCLESVFI